MIRSTPRESEPGHSIRGLFARFAAIYGLIWLAVLLGFAGISYPMLRKLAEAQVEKRLRTNAALVEEYVSAIGAYSDPYKPVLAQVCRRLSRPDLLDAEVTFFSGKAEVLADSRPGNALFEQARKRPEIEAALNKEAGVSIRYGRMERKRMIFAAYPHMHLGKVNGVVRIGVPYDSIDFSLWRPYLVVAIAGLGLAIVAAALSSLVVSYGLIPFDFPRLGARAGERRLESIGGPVR